MGAAEEPAGGKASERLTPDSAVSWDPQTFLPIQLPQRAERPPSFSAWEGGAMIRQDHGLEEKWYQNRGAVPTTVQLSSPLPTHCSLF